MGRIEELELEMERTERKIDASTCPRNQEELKKRQQELLDEIDSLQDIGLPEYSDTNELP